MSITASEEAAHAAVEQMDALIKRWTGFGIDQRVIDIAQYLFVRMLSAQQNQIETLAHWFGLRAVGFEVSVGCETASAAGLRIHTDLEIEAVQSRRHPGGV